MTHRMTSSSRLVSTGVPRLLLGLVLSVGFSLEAAEDPIRENSTQGGSTKCWEGVVPAASLPTQPPPVFCTIVNSGSDTAQAKPNGWEDHFDHGLFFADFEKTDYLLFDELNGIFDAIQWRHANHWMVDLAPLAPTAPGGAPFGAAMMRPNRTFQFENGELVVETTFAAGHLDYAPGSAWGEVVITDAPAPTGSRQGLTYGYHHFPGHYTLGCRLQWDGHSICSLMDDTDRGDLNGGRIWEMSFFQQVGETNYGGFPGVGGVESFRTCEADNVPDSQCRDRFRIAFGETSMTWHVNDHFYFEQTGIPQLPAELTDGPVYVYLASVSGNTDFEVIRYHWDRLLVNPDLSSLFQDGFETGDTAAWTSTVSQ